MPQHTLTVGEESPRPGGFAKGVGNGRPVTPLIQCGAALARKMPPKKQESRESQCMEAVYPDRPCVAGFVRY